MKPSRLTLRFPHLSILLVLLFASVGLLSAVGCGDDEPEGCIVSSDCPGDQICSAGQCVDPTTDACRDNSDCDSDETCVDSVCQSADRDTGTDAGNDTATETGNPDVVEEMAPEVFEDAPEVVSTVPAADAASGVALDGEVSVTFNQPMRDTSITPNVYIEDWRGNLVTRTVTYEADSRTVTLALATGTDRQPFEASSPYTLRVNREVRGENGLTMVANFAFEFTTVGYELDAYETLAEAYAPVVHAEVRPTEERNRNNRIDWFTRVDFDGDLDMSNNLVNAKSEEPLPAHVYWNVLESKTHYFIQYIFYYPLGADELSVSYSTAVIHDFAYSLVVVKKSDTDVLGDFVMASGLGDGQVWGFALDSYPSDSECGGDGQPDCRGVEIVVTDVMDTFSADELLPEVAGSGGTGRRYQMYLSDILHASCLATSAGHGRISGANDCDHPTSGDDAPFTSGNAAWSRILSFGEGGNWTTGEGEPAPSNLLTYSMSPFLDTFWAQRSNLSFYGGDFDYNTPENEDEVVPLPNGMALADQDRLNGDTSNPGRAGPFWVLLDVSRSCDDCTKKGGWFVDPAYALEGQVTFDHEIDHTYCFNPFRGIDIRGEEGCD